MYEAEYELFDGSSSTIDDDNVDVQVHSLLVVLSHSLQNILLKIY